MGIQSHARLPVSEPQRGYEGGRLSPQEAQSLAQLMQEGCLTTAIDGDTELARYCR